MVVVVVNCGHAAREFTFFPPRELFTIAGKSSRGGEGKGGGEGTLISSAIELLIIKLNIGDDKVVWHVVTHIFTLFDDNSLVRFFSFFFFLFSPLFFFFLSPYVKSWNEILLRIFFWRNCKEREDDLREKEGCGKFYLVEVNEIDVILILRGMKLLMTLGRKQFLFVSYFLL